MYKLPVVHTILALSLFLSPFANVIAEDIPEIIVTANRTANTVDETIAPVTIITRDDIERLQATSVVDVLRSTPGVDISTNGGLGSNASIYMRGTNSDQVLVLVDGIPYGSATSGTTAFQYLPVSQIERIEIVRGPQSSLYGSNAIGGIIQIFTNKSTKKGSQGQSFYANTGYGTDNTTDSTVGLGYANNASSINASVSYLDSDGYDFLGNPDPDNADNDDDGYDNTSISINGRHQFSEQLTLSGSYLLADGKNDYDSTNGLGLASKKTRGEFKQQVASLVMDLTINSIWSSQLLIGQSQDKTDSYRLPNLSTNIEKTYFNTTKNNLSWKNDFIIRDKDILTVGIDYLDESVDSTTDYDEDSRWTQGVFTQYQYYGDVFDVKASWRYDDNEQFGSYNTGNLGVGFDLDKNVRVSASYGKAYKAPTFNSLYWPVQTFPAYFYTYQGNPNLKPEESESFDFGLNGQFNSVSWTANYYTTKISNLITNKGQLNPVTFFWEEQPENIGKAHIDGLELTIKTQLMHWMVQGSISHSNPKDDDTGKILPNRSKDLFRLDLDRSIGQLSVGASVIAASERFTSSDARIPGYGIMNLRGSWQINTHWSIKAKIDNVFNKDYYTTQSFIGLPFNAQDRFAFASIHYKM